MSISSSPKSTTTVFTNHKDTAPKSQKERLWLSAIHPSFASTFCRFSNIVSHDLIPFHLLFHMHDTRRRVIHYLHQFLKLILIIHSVFRIHNITWSLHNLYLKKTERQRTFMFEMGDGRTMMMSCPEGYHVVVCGFEDCIVDGCRCPLTLTMMGCSKRPYDRLVRQLRRLLVSTSRSSCEDEGKYLDGLLCQMQSLERMSIRRFNVSSLSPEIVSRLIPLVDVGWMETMMETTTREDIRRMEEVFGKEFGVLTSKFKDTTKVHTMLEDWVKVLCVYKHEFMKNPETTVSVIRKTLYQYLVDRKYNHVSFENLDISRMIVSLYGWAHTLERWLCCEPSSSSSWANEVRWIGCMETVLDEVNADDATFEGEVYGMDFSSSSSSSSSFRVWRLPEDVRERLVRTHPLLRADVVCQAKRMVDK